MTDAEKWKKVESLMNRLSKDVVDDPEEILNDLAILAGELCPRLNAPAMLDDRAVAMHLPMLREMVKNYILHVDAEGMPPKDGDQYIYECALKVFYGDDIFDWYNKVVS